MSILNEGAAATWGIAALATGGVIIRPWRLPEAVWAVLGAAALVAFGLLSWTDAVRGIQRGLDVYLFLTGMMLLAELARAEGLFDWLAAVAVALARGSPQRLFALVYAVGTVVTVLLSGTSGRLAQRIGPRPPIVAGCLVCAVASMLAVRIGSHAGYWTAVFPLAVLFGLGLASLIPPLTASAMNSAPDSLAGLASGVNNAVARVAGLLWIAALPPITGLTGAAYADPAQFRSSFGQISWICAAAFACAAVLAATFITGPGRPTPAPRTALIQTPVPHLACPVAFGRAPGQTRRADSSPTSDPSRAADPPSPGRPG